MKRKIIPCQVRCEQVLGAGVVAGAAGSGGDAVLQLEFGPMWEGLVKYVTFRNALKEDPVTVILTTDMLERIVVGCGEGTDRCGMTGGETDCHGPAGLAMTGGGTLPPCGRGRPHGAAPTGSPRKGEAFSWGEEEQRSGMDVRRSRTEWSEVCDDVGEGCPCREALVYNVPIPPKAKAIAGQMGVVVQGYAVAEDGTKIEGAVMTANAYYKILPADYAPVEDGSVTPTLSQQLQGEIEKIKKDILGAAGAADAKEAAQRAAAEAQAHRTAAETARDRAEEKAQAAAGEAEKAGKAAGEAGSAQAGAQAARLEAQRAQEGAETAGDRAQAAAEAAEEAKDRAGSAQVEAQEAERRGKGYRDEALAAREAAKEAQAGAERARDRAVSAKETAEECRTQAWIERLLAQDARDRAEEYAGRAERAKEGSETAERESKKARDEAVLALQQIRMDQEDIRGEQREIKALGTEVRRLREETGTDREAAQAHREAAERAQAGAEKAQSQAVQARLGAEAAAGKAEEWAQAARDLSGGDVATRREAKGYVKAHNADPLAHEGVFPRIGAVAGERERESWRPDYGLGGGGEEGGERSVALETEDYTGRAYLSAVVSGREYDAVNLETEEEVAGNGTLIVRREDKG